ncbi:hypothetical protein ACLQ2V_27705 [Micromonospora sp. DT233]
MLVTQGILFGSSRIALVDIVISAMVVITGTALYRQRVRLPTGEGMPSTLLTTAVAVLGLPAVIGGLLNLVAPATPGDLPLPACATVQTYKTPYRATTTGPNGNFARWGPGLSFTQSDRFNKGCVLGFSGYCIGDPVKDPQVDGWSDTRWLLTARHGEEPARTLARWLSDESPHKRFVSSSYLAPQSPNSALDYLGDDQCTHGLPQPGKAVLTTRAIPDESGRTPPHVVGLVARAPHAFNIGFALSLSDPTALEAGTPLRQIPGSGAVTSDGSLSVQWDTSILRGHLRKQRIAPVTVTVLAVPCLDPLAPAGSESLTTLAFSIPTNPAGTVTRVPASALSKENQDRLLTLACDTELSTPRKPAA